MKKFLTVITLGFCSFNYFAETTAKQVITQYTDIASAVADHTF